MKPKSDDILHSGRLGSFSTSAAKYTSSIDIDGRLLSNVVAINSAHVVMLAERSIIEKTVATQILGELRKIPRDLEMREELEDVHMNVEDRIITHVGKEVGGMLNLGKSRNDQVATALRMTLREQLIILGNSMVMLQKALLTKAAKSAGSPMPGYTHLQRGQPVTLGHHFLAHFDSLDRDFSRLVDCYLRVNQSPMGAGALASTGYDIDRERVANLLGFDSVLENSLDAVSSRDYATEAIFLCVQTMTDLSRLAEEIILWSTKEFSFVEISDKHASTSSMMPQKKNAVIPEIFRARTSQVLGDLVAALGLLKALPLSYNLDLQELTRNLWSAIDKTVCSVQVLGEVIDAMNFNTNTLLEAATSDDFLYSTELADYLVTKHKIPFREAHGRVGKLIRFCSTRQTGFRNLDPDIVSRQLGIQISRQELELITSPNKTLERRSAFGSPNPKLVSRASKQRIAEIANHEKTLYSLQKGLVRSREVLSSAIDKIKQSSHAIKVGERNRGSTLRYIGR